MLYLSGHPHRSLIGMPNLGFILTPYRFSRPDLSTMPWAADTGCFKNPDDFSSDRYWKWLRKHNQSTLLFATAPDRLGDWKRTLDVAIPVLSEMTLLSIPPAFVAQDGLTPDNTPWPAFDCLFIGGTTEWKESRHVERLCRAAKQKRKWLHMGRVNSLRRIQLARDWGCDSVDGNQLVFGRDKYRREVETWLKICNDQGQFFS